MQILAWNGGGSSNYSGIVSQGGYTVDAADSYVRISLPSKADIEKDISSVEAAVEESRNNFEHATRKTVESVSRKAEKVSGRIEDFVADELRDFFEEIRA